MVKNYQSYHHHGLTVDAPSGFKNHGDWGGGDAHNVFGRTCPKRYTFVMNAIAYTMAAGELAGEHHKPSDFADAFRRRGYDPDTGSSFSASVEEHLGYFAGIDAIGSLGSQIKEASASSQDRSILGLGLWWQVDLLARPYFDRNGELSAFPEREPVHQMLACCNTTMEDTLRRFGQEEDN